MLNSQNTDTHPPDDQYVLGAELRLVGWEDVRQQPWGRLAEEAAAWLDLQARGLDLYVPPAGETGAQKAFRTKLLNLVAGELYAFPAPHPWQWMFDSNTSPLLQSSLWTMRGVSPALLDQKEAVVNRRLALLQRVHPALMAPVATASAAPPPCMKDYITCPALPAAMPAARYVDTLDNPREVLRTWEEVAIEERAVNRRHAAEGLPMVRVHAQLEVGGAPRTRYAEADLAVVRALAAKYAHQPHGGGAGAVARHACALVHRAVSGADPAGQDQVGDCRLVTSPRPPKALTLRVYIHRDSLGHAAHDAQVLRPADVRARCPVLASLMPRQDSAANRAERHKHLARLYETLRGPHQMSVRERCDQDNKAPAHALRDAVVCPARGAAAAGGVLPHQHPVLARMADMERVVPPFVAVPPPASGLNGRECVLGVSRVPGLPLLCGRRAAPHPVLDLDPVDDTRVDAPLRKKLDFVRRCRRRGGVLMQTPGLGKMIETLLLIRQSRRQRETRRRAGATLVLCPAAVAPTWAREAAARQLAAACADVRDLALDLDATDVVVCTYESLTTPDKVDAVFALPRRAGGLPWDRVVLDESQKIVGNASKRAQSILDTLQRPEHANAAVWCLTIPDYRLTLLLQYARRLFFHRSPFGLEDLKRAHDMYRVRQESTGINSRTVGPLQRLLGGVFLLQTEAHLRAAGMASVPLHPHTVELPAPGYLRTLAQHQGHVLRLRMRREGRPWMLALRELERTVLGLRPPAAALVAPADPSRVLSSAAAARALVASSSDVPASAFVQSMAQRIGEKRKHTEDHGAGRAKRPRSEEHGPAPEHADAEEVCPICHEDYVREDHDTTLTVVRACGHAFHRPCLRRWLDAGGGACPVCRAEITPGSLLHFSSREPEAAGGAPMPPEVAVARAAVPPLTDSPKIAYLRDALLAKIPEDEKVVVMCRSRELHAAVVESLAAAGVPLCTIRAGQTSENREKERQTFQDAPVTEARVMVMTTQTAGVGITLTRANHLVLLEPALSPKVKEQAVGRVHRQCQTRPVHVHTLAVRDTLDTRVLEVDAAAAMSREEAEDRGLCRRSRTERKDFLLTGY